MFTAPELEHVVIAVPALTVGGAAILIVLVPFAAEQPPGALDVNVSVIVPVKVPAGV